MNPSQEELASRAIWPLLALNFFMADMQAGIGPFIGVFLLAHGWESGLIGTVMTLGGITGMLITTALGLPLSSWSWAARSLAEPLGIAFFSPFGVARSSISRPDGARIVPADARDARH